MANPRTSKELPAAGAGDPDRVGVTDKEDTHRSEDRLDSWKEIANYLGRDKRTVQRWERTESLPIHRHEHEKKSTVYAYTSELDEWRKTRQPKDDPEADAAFEPDPEDENGADEIGEQEIPPVPEPRAPLTPTRSGSPREWFRAIAPRLILFGSVALLVFTASYFGYKYFSGKISRLDKVRLVVLPFSNLSGDAKQDYVSAGLTEEITTQLGRLDPQHLSVIAPTSAKLVSHEAVTQIGEQLRVKYVLEGSVQSVASQIRIEVRLIETSGASYAWTQSFTRQLSDLLQVESDVADAVGRQILAALPAPPPSKARDTSPSIGPAPTSGIVGPQEIAKSRDDYLRGLFTWGSRGDFRANSDLRGSIDFYQQAIQEDPSYAQAYAGLAAATAILGQVPNDGLAPRDAKPKAREAAKRALQLDPRLGDAHAVLGNVAMSYDWDLAAAEKELQRAIELNPNDSTSHEWYAHLLIVEGRNGEALAEARRSLDLSPVSPLFHTVLAETYYYGRNYDAAIERAQQVVNLHPDYLLAQFWLGSAYREKKMYAQAVQTFDRARKLSGDNPAMVMAYGHAQAIAGNAAEARAALHTLEQLRATRFVPSLYPAGIYLGMGDSSKALDLLDRAYEERIDRLVFLGVDPMADPLRSNPRFRDLLHRIGLPAT